MKNFKILPLALLTIVLVSSCKDETGTYAEQLYTNDEKAAAFKTCLTTSLDSALSHLCTVDGFYQYLDGKYRIDFNNIQTSVFDTLAHHNMANLSDTLIRITNKMAENCGDPIKRAFSDAINHLDFIDYDGLLYGDSTAITQYFELYKYADIFSALQSPISIRMNLYGVNEQWTQVISAYKQYDTPPVNIDFQGYIIDKIIDDVFEEMALEEINIRTDASHRTEKDSLLGV